MRKTLVAQLALAGTIGLAAALVAGTAAAAICSACHTMHNSQGGAAMRTGGPLPLAQPLAKLLLNDCIGCHTGVNSQTVPGVFDEDQPKIYSAAVPTYGTNTLAGGNFYWATQLGSENTGHNVVELGVADPVLGNTPPGHTGALVGGQLTCAGTRGCHGDRSVADTMSALQGAHHLPHNDVDDATLTGASVGLSFRYLKGVTGREDTDWEFTTTDGNPSTNHNIYKGVDRTGVAETTAADASSINALCGQCHGAFHREGNDIYGVAEGAAGIIGTANWIRHPTDYDMPLTVGSEYAGYTTYKALTPVGMATLPAGAGSIDVTVADSRIVLCVSCHRAHGSPYADILRWDYATMLTGASAVGETGCFACHTFKDAP